FYSTPTAPADHYTLSLHDALPISGLLHARPERAHRGVAAAGNEAPGGAGERRICPVLPAQGRHLDPQNRRPGGLAALEERRLRRSEEHTSELQSPCNLVCRLLLEK